MGGYFVCIIVATAAFLFGEIVSVCTENFVLNHIN